MFIFEFNNHIYLMNKQKIYTVNSFNLYNILEEIKDFLNFNVEFIELSKIKNEELKKEKTLKVLYF